MPPPPTLPPFEITQKKGKKDVDRKALLPFSIGVVAEVFLEAAVRVGMATGRRV